MPEAPRVRTRAIFASVAWRPDPLDVVLLLGFLSLCAGVALLSIPAALIVAGLLLMAAWGRIAIVSEARRESNQHPGA